MMNALTELETSTGRNSTATLRNKNDPNRFVSSYHIVLKKFLEVMSLSSMLGRQKKQRKETNFVVKITLEQHLSNCLKSNKQMIHLENIHCDIFLYIF